MEFEWDEAKRERNRRARSLSFDLAWVLFDGLVVMEADERRDYGEVRQKAIGVIDGIICACIFTDRGGVRRVISLRVANRSERRVYRAAGPV